MPQKKHEGTVSIGGRTITNLRFADDIDDDIDNEQYIRIKQTYASKFCSM